VGEVRAPQKRLRFWGRPNLVEPAARTDETRGATEGSDAAPTLLLYEGGATLV